MTQTAHLTIGVLALQGAFSEHVQLLRKAAASLQSRDMATSWTFIEVRTPAELEKCDALIIPGGESTTISLVAERSGMLEPLREFVKVLRKPVWGTCAGLILLAESANRTKKGGQELIGGLDVRVNRNHFGRQVESFGTDIDLPFLQSSPDAPKHLYPGIFIRAPVVEKILPHVEGEQTVEAHEEETVIAPSKRPRDDDAREQMAAEVEVLARLPGRAKKLEGAGSTTSDDGDIIAVRQGNCFGTSFHPELTGDARIHVWWLQQILGMYGRKQSV